jgi:hypothetical protein
MWLEREKKIRKQRECVWRKKQTKELKEADAEKCYPVQGT